LLVILFLVQVWSQENLFTCKQELPHLSVNDYILNEALFKRLVQSDQITAIVITASWFQNSCKYESFWKQLKSHVLDRNNIKLGRVDFQNSKWLMEHIKVERVPMLVFAKKGKFYMYNSVLDTLRIQAYLDKITQPVVELKNMEEAEKFFAEEKLDSQGRLIQSTKVLGIFYDLEDMDEDLKEFRIAAEQLIDSPDIYFATLTVKSEIKRAQKKHQDHWFEDYSLSSIVIQKGADQYNKIDLSDTRRILLRDIIKYRSLPLLQEYNFQNHNYYEKTNLPMLVGVVDSANDYPHFMNFFFLLEKIAIEYIDRVHFTWVDGVFNKNKKKMLGIEHDKLPTMAFNLILDPKNNTLAYPEKWVLSADKISQFVNDYITYSLYDLKILYGKEKQAQKSAIYNFFTNVQEFGLNNLTSTLTKKKNTDYVLFIFNSQNKIPDLESHVKSFNHIARRFQQLQIKKVEFGVYDTFYFQLPEVKK